VLISVLSRATTAVGVPAGAKKPCHRVRSKFGSLIASATVGTPGAPPARLAEDTARIFTWPPFNSGVAAGKPGKYISTWLPSRSLSAGPAPL
jgi:hypothetical protein